MIGDNLSGADNQQERPSPSDWLDGIPSDLGHYVAGFVDGEGSFNVPIRRERDRRMPWRASLCFNVSQIGQGQPMLLRTVFGVVLNWRAAATLLNPPSITLRTMASRPFGVRGAFL